MSVFSLFGKGVSTVRGVHIRFRKSLPANERIKLRIYIETCILCGAYREFCAIHEKFRHLKVS